MPELPEVEALAADLRSRVVGRVVERLEVATISALKTYDPPPTALAGARLDDCGRFGKFLDLRFSEGGTGAGGDQVEAANWTGGGAGGPLHLVVHLARAGWLHYRESLTAAPLRPGKGPIALRLRLAGGGGFDLTEQGTQKRLAAYLVRDPGTVPGVARLGPDALAASQEEFIAAITSRAGRLKGVLTDQEVLAGIGNAYSDEIAHRARLSPYAVTTKLTPQQRVDLHLAVRAVLGDAVSRSVGQGAASLKGEKRSGFAVHDRTGLPCPVCADTVREVAFADSSLQYCPTCQTGGRPLADRRLSRLLR